ncbi:MAG: hypothetical protein ACFFB2_02730 [Promethearchaeota archaeon]
MISRSLLTSVIGFLSGCLLYYTIEASVFLVLVMGCVGYFLGLILDKTDIKIQPEIYHFSSISTSREIFQSKYLPEALITYSAKENLTNVSIDFQVEVKPQDFRLSVLKNLLDHQFRVSEDSSKTIFSLSLDYPEYNYPKGLYSDNQTEQFLYDIREHSLDFQNAVQKIVPGMVLTQLLPITLYGEEENELDQSPSYRISPSHPSHSIPSNISKKDFGGDKRDINFCHKKLDQKTSIKELIDYPSNSELETINQNRTISQDGLSEGSDDVINEFNIMEDLLVDSQTEFRVPDLSPEDIKHLKNYNQNQLELFLNEKPAGSTPSVLISAKKPTTIESEDYENKTDGSKDSADEKKVDNKIEEDDKIRIDLSNLKQSSLEKTDLDEFNTNIISRIDKRTQEAINKINISSEMHE